MIRFDVGKWEGLAGLGDEELAKLRVTAALAVERAGIYLTAAVKKTLGPAGGARTGRLYKRKGKRGKMHQASAPGQPPAILRGILRQSVNHSQPLWEGWSVSVEVGIPRSVPYGRRLEYGGIDARGVRILPRPYFAPTLLREMVALQRILEQTTAMSAQEAKNKRDERRAAALRDFLGAGDE